MITRFGSQEFLQFGHASSVVVTREESCPVQIAGSPRMLARSLTQRRRRLISCAVCSVVTLTSTPAYDLRQKMRLNTVCAVSAALARIRPEA